MPLTTRLISVTGSVLPTQRRPWVRCRQRRCSPAVFTANHVNAMTHAQLDAVSMFYNDDFNIVAGDAIAARRGRFLDWLTV